jgi:hypothetical protein
MKVPIGESILGKENVQMSLDMTESKKRRKVVITELTCSIVAGINFPLKV